MDLLSRCKAALNDVEKAREQVDAWRPLSEPRSSDSHFAAVSKELQSFDLLLARRAREVGARVAQFELTGHGAEELELEIGLTSYLVQKFRVASRSVQSELDPRPLPSPPDEEPLA